MSSNLSSNIDSDSDDSGVKIMMVSLTFLFFILVFVLCLHLYAKRFRFNNHHAAAAASRRRRRLDFAVTRASTTTSHDGLDPSVLKTIPIIAFDPKEFRDIGLECAVCLSEVSEGENLRLLPKCNHGFHVDCIDMWFQSHSTCPLCRSHVHDYQKKDHQYSSNSTEATMEADHQSQNHEGGDVDEHSSSSSMASEELMIQIPQQTNEEDEDEHKSPSSTRFNFLNRILSRGDDTRIHPSISPRNLDLDLQV